METLLRTKNKLRNIFHSLKNNLFFHLSTKDQIFFIKRLSFLIRADIPLLESLLIIRDQTKTEKYKKVLEEVIERVSSGEPLSESLSKFGKMFGGFVISMVSFGEASGMLSENLEYVAIEMKKKQLLKRKIIAAFIYPAIVTVATGAISIFLLTYLLPKIIPVFKSLHIQLPLSTQIVMEISRIVTRDGLLIMICLILLIAAFFTAKKRSERFHVFFDRMLLHIPLIHNMLRSYHVASSTRTLGLLLKSGVTESEALPVVAKTSRNTLYKKAFEDLSPIVERGEKMSVYFKERRELFPDMMAHIVAVGERSGSLSHSLLYLSELHEEEVDDFTKNLSSLIEPVLMITMGIVVGFIAISIITPIYGITQNLHP